MKNTERRVVFNLNQLLASLNIYAQNLKSFHWNVKGSDFFDLHEKFENLYLQALSDIDQIAERILNLNFKPYSSFSLYIENSEIEETTDISRSKEMLITILEQQDLLVEKMKEIISLSRDEMDFTTASYLEQSLKIMEKENWMLHTWMKNTKERQVSKGISFA